MAHVVFEDDFPEPPLSVEQRVSLPHGGRGLGAHGRATSLHPTSEPTFPQDASV